MHKRFVLGAMLALASLAISACNTGGGNALPDGVPSPITPTASPTPSASPT